MDRSDEVLVQLVNGAHQRAAIDFAVTDSVEGNVTVLNVITPLDEPLSEGGILRVTNERRQAARDRASILIEEATERDSSTVDIEVAAGRPASTVADQATKHDVEHLVMGVRDHSGLPSIVFGRNVATIVDDLTDVSVTVIDTPG